MCFVVPYESNLERLSLNDPEHVYLIIWGDRYYYVFKGTIKGFYPMPLTPNEVALLLKSEFTFERLYGNA